MLFSLFALAIQVAGASDNVVAVTHQGEGRYQLVLTTTENAKSAATKMKAAMDDACRDTGIASRSAVFLAMLGEKPLRAQLMQTVTCKAIKP